MVQSKWFSGGIVGSAAMLMVVACGQANTETADSSSQSIEQPCKQKAGAGKKKHSRHARLAKHRGSRHWHGHWHGPGAPPAEEPSDEGAAGAEDNGETEPPNGNVPGTGGTDGAGGSSAGPGGDDDDDADTDPGESTGGSSPAAGGSMSTGGSGTSSGASSNAAGAPNDWDEPAVCGNGYPEGAESCDDGNAEPGDGCSDACQTEPGWSCPYFGEPCHEVICGDGQTDWYAVDAMAAGAGGASAAGGSPGIGGAATGGAVGAYYGYAYEECDDGNAVDGDGCSSQCVPEVGYICEAPGESCRRVVCGDGLQDSYAYSVGTETIYATEHCDEGNPIDNDGCSATCAIETGYNCDIPGEPCWRVVCGDGSQDWYATAPSVEPTPENPYGYTMGAYELCDDGNAISGDGCSAQCIPEPNFSCSPGEPCKAAVCGDGAQDWYVSEVIDLPSSGTGGVGGAGPGTGGSEGGRPGADWGDRRTTETVQVNYGYEQCDDGNVASSDGCNATCSIEPGYHCDGPGAPCKLAVCGDAIVDYYFYLATGSGDAGDGVGGAMETGGASGIAGGDYGWEDCDDGNAMSGDGCSDTCKAESGWVCDAPGQPCRQPVCGDGFQDYYPVEVAGSVDTGTGGWSGDPTWTEWIYEDCDDGNTIDGDGCSATCGREPGYVCTQPGQPCRQPVCGDGFQDEYEAVVPGSTYPSEPTRPGVGGSAGTSGSVGTGGSMPGSSSWVYEACDDGNSIDGDGCNQACELETGWSCRTPGEPCIVPVCGDGYEDYPVEECDDGNTESGDGCSATCTWEWTD